MSLLHWIAALAFGLGAEEGARFEVLVLGTYHAPAMFTNDRYTPGHIRATLGSARPDVVAVESHPTWFDAGPIPRRHLRGGRGRGRRSRGSAGCRCTASIGRTSRRGTGWRS